MSDHSQFKNKINSFKFSVGDLKNKMKKLLKMCDSTDFKQNEAFETLQEGLINILEIKNLNCEIQKVKKNKNIKNIFNLYFINI